MPDSSRSVKSQTGQLASFDLKFAVNNLYDMNEICGILLY